MSGVKFFWFNYVDQDATEITATSEDSFFPASNLKNTLSTKVYRTPTGTLSGAVVFDFKTISKVDSILARGNQIEGLGSTSTLTIMANATNEWSSPAFTTTLTIDAFRNFGMKTLSTAQSYRFWRVSGSGSPYFELSNIFIGQFFQPVRNFSFNWSRDPRDLSAVQSNRYGQSYSDETVSQDAFTGNFRLVDRDERSKLDEMIDYVGITKGFWMVLDEQASFTGAQGLVAGLYKFRAKPKDSNPNFRLFNYNFSMVVVN